MMTAKSIALASSAALILTGASAAQVVLSDRNAAVDPGANPASWIYYEVTGGFAGIRHGLRILDDGQAFARESASGRLVAQAAGIVALEDLESLDASVRAVFRSAAAGQDGCQGADHLHYALKSAVRGFPESLQTCAPTAEEQALFQELDAVRAQVLAGPKDVPVKLLDGKILLSDASGVRQGGVSILSTGQGAVWTSSDGRRDLQRFRIDATALQVLADSIEAASADAVGVQDAWGPKVIIDYGPPPMQPHEPSRGVLNSSAGNGPVPPGGGVWDPGSDDDGFGGASKDPASTVDSSGDEPSSLGQKKDPASAAGSSGDAPGSIGQKLDPGSVFPDVDADQPGVGKGPDSLHDLDDVPDDGIQFEIKIYDPRGVMTLLPGDCTAAHNFGLSGLMMAFLCNG